MQPLPESVGEGAREAAISPAHQGGLGAGEKKQKSTDSKVDHSDEVRRRGLPEVESLHYFTYSSYRDCRK